MNPNTQFVKYIIIGGIIATFAIPFICAWLDDREERRTKGKDNRKENNL